jgi:hypothetical protein
MTPEPNKITGSNAVGTELVTNADALGRPGRSVLSLIWLFLCQAGSKLFFRFFHGSSSDLAQWTVELAPAA